MELIQWLDTQRSVIHLVLHVLAPLLAAGLFASKKHIKTAFLLMMMTMLVDVDHLLATPIYQPDRCSILFHPLHQVWAMVIYAAMVIWPLILRVLNKKIKPMEVVIGWLGAGLVIHMALDSIDCIWMRGGFY